MKACEKEVSSIRNAPVLCSQFNLDNADGDRFFPLRSHEKQDFNVILESKIEIESRPPLNLFDDPEL